MVLQGAPHLICTQIFKIRKVERVVVSDTNLRESELRGMEMQYSQQ